MARNLDRREFHSLAGSAFAALLASGCVARAPETAGEASGYGPLIADPANLIDLPQGFTYRVISSLGDMMDDGEAVPDGADGMGTFQGKNGRVILIRNHELKAEASGLAGAAYDRWKDSGALPGGTTTIVYTPATGLVEDSSDRLPARSIIARAERPHGGRG